ADLNNDRWLDLVVIKGRRRSILNTSTLPNDALEVTVDHRGGVDSPPPIGAIVRAYYSDGTVRAQRFGSASNTRWSQSLLPLHFGMTPDVPITELGVTWPGDTEE